MKNPKEASQQKKETAQSPKPVSKPAGQSGPQKSGQPGMTPPKPGQPGTTPPKR